MGVEDTADQVANGLRELGAEFPGWRVGRGGSGRWWAVRRSTLVSGANVVELRERLLQHTAESAPGG